MKRQHWKPYRVFGTSALIFLLRLLLKIANQFQLKQVMEILGQDVSSNCSPRYTQYRLTQFHVITILQSTA